MPEFVMLFLGRAAQPQAEDAQTQDYNRRWTEYMGGLAQAGKLKDGAPFAPTGKVVGKDTVSDLELDEVDIGGFTVLEVDSLDEAVEIAKRAPHAELGGTTIVRPCAR